MYHGLFRKPSIESRTRVSFKWPNLKVKVATQCLANSLIVINISLQVTKVFAKCVEGVKDIFSQQT
jgi:hypothetical protein